MLRYFKFENIGTGYVLYDGSYNKEHCYIYDSTMWATTTTLLPLIYAASAPTTTTLTSMTGKYLRFLNGGPILPAPRRVSSFEEGFTIETWIHFNALPSSGTYSLAVFDFTTPEGQVKATID